MVILPRSINTLLDFYPNQAFGFSRQEEICQKTEFIVVNEYFEQIFDELSRAKAMVLQEIYCIYLSW